MESSTRAALHDHGRLERADRAASLQTLMMPLNGLGNRFGRSVGRSIVMRASVEQ